MFLKRELSRSFYALSPLYILTSVVVTANGFFKWLLLVCPPAVQFAGHVFPFFSGSCQKQFVVVVCCDYRSSRRCVSTCFTCAARSNSSSLFVTIIGRRAVVFRRVLRVPPEAIRCRCLLRTSVVAPSCFTVCVCGHVVCVCRRKPINLCTVLARVVQCRGSGEICVRRPPFSSWVFPTIIVEAPSQHRSHQLCSWPPYVDRWR
jgi:hypothetical protein